MDIVLSRLLLGTVTETSSPLSRKGSDLHYKLQPTIYQSLKVFRNVSYLVVQNDFLKCRKTSDDNYIILHQISF
jgi:hypothetical protein